MHISRNKQQQKKEHGHFEQHTSNKKSSETLAMFGWSVNRVVYISSSKSSEPKTFVQHLNNV